MSVATLTSMPDRGDSLRRALPVSVALHGLLFAVVVVAPYIGKGVGFGWGTGSGSGSAGALGSATHVDAVASLPGVPLPAPMLATPSTLATESPGLYQPEPQPKEQPPPEAEAIPKFKDAVKVTKPIAVNKRIQKAVITPPPNAIPFGVGGRPSLSYGNFSGAAGSGGLNIGGDFGERYGWYVTAVQNRISSNWLLSTVSPEIVTAPRVYVTFDIRRDGSISNPVVTKSSGIPEVDRSAMRAVLASNPLGPLPADYAGDKVTVGVYFDFNRH
jgi:periplasmic protein TonB